MRLPLRGVVALVCIGAVAAVASGHHPIINEFVADHVGDDTNEYIEIIFLPRTDLSVFTLLEIEGDSDENPGRIDATFQVGTTGENSIWWTGFNHNAQENGTLTYLLVLNFDGLVGDDIDTDDDGEIDATFWNWIADMVGVLDGGEGDLNYADTVLDVSHPPSGSTVSGASRIPNGFDSNNADDWRRNAFNGEGIPGLPGGELDRCEAVNTPGEVNQTREPKPGVLSPATWLFPCR